MQADQQVQRKVEQVQTHRSVVSSFVRHIHFAHSDPFGRLGLAFGLAFGLASGLAFGLASGLAFGLASGLAFGIAFDPAEHPLNLGQNNHLLVPVLRHQVD